MTVNINELILNVDDANRTDQTAYEIWIDNQRSGDRIVCPPSLGPSYTAELMSALSTQTKSGNHTLSIVKHLLSEKNEVLWSSKPYTLDIKLTIDPVPVTIHDMRYIDRSSTMESTLESNDSLDADSAYIISVIGQSERSTGGRFDGSHLLYNIAPVSVTLQRFYNLTLSDDTHASITMTLPQNPRYTNIIGKP